MAKKMSSEFTSIKDKMQKLAEADAKAKEQAKERAAKKKELAAQLAALKKEREQQLATVFGTVFVKLYGNKVDTVFAKHITRGNVPTVAAVEQFFKKAHFDFSELPAEQEAKTEEKASVPSELHALHDAAISFLRERFYVWHHAMRRLVPDIMIPNTVLESLRCNEAEPVIGLIQMNAMMLKGSYTMLRYSSLSDEELAKEQPHSLRLAL